MRILTLSNSPLVESQGSGYVVLNYVRGLRDRGHYVDLCGPESLELFSRLQKARSHRVSVGMLVEACRRLASTPYDVMEFYGGESWLAVSVLTAMPKRRFLLVAHANGLETHYREVLQQRVGTASLDGAGLKWYQTMLHPPIQRAFTKVDGLVTVSSADRDYALRENYQPPSRIVALDNPLPDDYLDRPVDFHRSPTVGFCGAWSMTKGSTVMRADMSAIVKEFPACRFKLIGVGADFRVADWFPPEVCSRVDVIPFVEEKVQLRKIYESLAIVIVPSLFESFGLVTAEAMACGCAVVATRTGFAASLHHREEAMLMDEPTSPALYENVRALLTNNDLRMNIAQRGYARVQNLRWPSAIEALERVYLGWLEEFRSTRRSVRLNAAEPRHQNG